MKYLAVITLLLASIPRVVSGQRVDSLDALILTSMDDIVEIFGEPARVDDLEEKDALVWTYFFDNVVSPVEESDSTVYYESAKRSLLRLPFNIGSQGYLQFAFWNDRVAAVSHVSTSESSESIYHRSHEYMKAHAGTISGGAGSENARITRRGDNVWVIDTTVSDNTHSSVIRIGDAGYIMCSKSRPAEMKRVKSMFGINL